MCLKDNEGGIVGIEKEKSEDMEKTVDCPLCLEPLELDDKKFFPCSCGYQVCRFCWHRIRTNENCLCPACRRIYPENPANFQPLTPEEIQKVKQQKKMKDMQKKQKIAENRKQLANIRVIQRNLVFAVGLPIELSQDAEKKEKILQMFRQFGVTLKETITDKTSYAGTQGPGSCIYITYQKCEDAVRAVKSLANTKIDGRIIKVSLGTTKYCSHFLKNAQCPKAECLYLHELADEEASFTKEDIHLGKHYEYEQKLLEQTLNTASQNKIISESRTNHNRNVDNCSESSEEQNPYSLQHNSCGSESSELSPTSNSQNIENLRNIGSEMQNEIESNHQNSYSVNSEIRCNLEESPKPVFRSEENILVNNHSTNHNFQNSSLNPSFTNQILQQKESEPSILSQPNFMSNQMFENMQYTGQSSCSSFLKKIIQSQSSQSSSFLVNDSAPKNSVQDSLILNQEHSNTRQNARDDDADLEFDPCEESLRGLEKLLILEAKEKEQQKLQYIEAALNRSSLGNHRSPTSYELCDSYNRNPPCATLQPLKMRDPPPGFANNCTQNMHLKPSFETASLNKAISLQNHLGARTNFSVQRFTQQPAIPNNNSFLPDYTATLSREIPEVIPPVLQQHNQQRLMNLSQMQYPSVPEQRTSPLWNNTSQTQRWPMENSLFNHSVIENRVSNDFNMRMPTRTSELAALRQWQQQYSGNVNNLSPFQDHSALSEQNAKLQAMYKSIEAARNSPSFGHRLQYTKKL